MANPAIEASADRALLSGGGENLTAALGSAVGQRQVLVYLLILVCTLVGLAHLPALSARAAFHDDSMYVGQNMLVQNPSWASVQRFFLEVWEPSTVSGYYQPVTMVSLMMDRYLGGPKDMTRTCHRTSLLLHMGNTALVALLLYMLFGHAVVAAGVALLFGLHPMTVESVCWISERKTVLATFFALWSLCAYVRYTRDPKRRYYVGCTLAFVLALLAKPIVVALPVMLLLMDYWPLNRLQRRSIAEKIPLLALSAVFAVITYVSQSRAASIKLPGADYDPLHIPLILCHNIVFYLTTLLWPTDLLAYYDFPAPMSLSHPRVLAGVVGTAILLPLLIVSRRWTRALIAGWLMFFVMILPAMGIISVTPTIAANRYAYLPSIGFLLVLASCLAWWITRAGTGVKLALRHVAGALFLLALAGLETVPLRHYLAQWQDPVRLNEYMLALAPHSARLHASMGIALTRKGDLKGAIEHYDNALAQLPNSASIRYNLAITLQGLPGKIDETIAHYEKLLEADSMFTLQATSNLGDLRLRKGQVKEAIDHYRTVLAIQTNFPKAHRSLGKVLLARGEPEEGIEHLRKAVRISPGFLLAVRDLGWVLATHPNEEIRDPNEAVALAERARDMTGGRNTRVLDILAAAYACDEQYDKAIEVAEKAHQMAVRMRNDELAGWIAEHLQAYEMERPYLESPRVQLDRLVAKAKREEQAATVTPTLNSTLETQN